MDLINQQKISCVDESSSAMDRAQAVATNLYPNFLRRLLKSHVTGEFRLNLPKPFCDAHLPKQSCVLVLSDENDREYNTKYAVGKNRLTSGWKSFSIAHKLLEGDILVFQLIEPCKFKVYIVKATRLTQVDGATTTALPNQNFHPKSIEAVKTEPEQENTNPTEYPHEHDYYSEIANGKRSSEYSLINVKDVKGFKDFTIYVDGISIDSEMPIQCKAKYYELCKSRNMFLHENLVQGLNGKLAAEMISETIKIADAIRAVDSKTAPARMEGWDKTLKAFEDLGMVVGFLRVRIHELLSISRENQASVRLKRVERDGAEEEMRALDVKLSRVKTRIEKIDSEIDALAAENEGLDPVFKEIAHCPW
ncbi:PREDICTED: B3 domain-containing protein Os01g0234100-like isoform X1 [Erythranthe guttata]|uniref:B3 domain-containing protein Os01g0234100-like isoform X1 n=1 Tax=Erythranthe guttata TaxID=4155 RepID=UPI00064DBE97|nr:PREDICTED: B3 domain-containing protein Os01g0234100-like isoform X1 [Erythranthe guttata]|eukprot:XP_012831050.1 PREDICTED: B3 domain-containing protein Os01g0234100-like isoform X1 [Erythranthe guttata]